MHMTDKNGRWPSRRISAEFAKTILYPTSRDTWRKISKSATNIAKKTRTLAIFVVHGI